MAVRNLRRKWEQEKLERRQFERECINTRLERQADGSYKVTRWSYESGDLA